MSYYSVPIIIDDVTGALRIAENSSEFSEILYISNTEAYVHAPNNENVPNTWTPITEDQWNNATIPAPTLAQVQAQKLLELDAAYVASFSTFKSSALGTTNTYPCDDEAVKNFTKYSNLLTLNPNYSTVEFKTMENGIVPHTRDQFIQVLTDYASHEVSWDKQYEAYENTINTTTDFHTLQGMTFSFS